MTKRAAACVLIVPFVLGDGTVAGPSRVRLDAPSGSEPAVVARLEAAANGGAEAAAAWLALPLADGVALPLRWFESHEAMGRELGVADFVLEDPTTGPMPEPARDRVVFTFGSGGSGGLPADDANVERIAARAGACAAACQLVPAATPRMRAALAELVVDPACADECTRLARALRDGALLPELSLLRDPSARLSPEIARVAAISLLAAQPPGRRLAAMKGDESAAAAWSKALLRAPEDDSARAPKAAPTVVPVGLRGFCFAHEGYRWVDGYGSRAAARSLARVRELGADAVSLIPFAFQRDPSKPAIAALFERSGSGGFGGAPETDAALAATAADAHALGLTVVLKPQVWCGHGRWCGEIAMTSEADWAEWFAGYERVIVHYALLARRLAIPVLCLATELQGTTPHEREWRALIAKVRTLYPGVLTVCANWGDEVQKLKFWDALDVVGVSAYWPLADGPGADRAAIARRFDDVLERMRALGARVQRPIWFLEIGFADVKEPWIAPNENQGAADGGIDQAIAYRVVLDATAAARFPDALFWWKWSSDPGRVSPDGQGGRWERWHDFWPSGRPAETELERAWSRAR